MRKLALLVADAFAVPETREVPLHDKAHVAMAWRVIGNMPRLTDEQRVSARQRTLAAACELGMDTTRWEVESISLDAMALEFPEEQFSDHPNKLPFTGILTRLDCASDKALQGTGGKKVIIPVSVAKEAIASLLGMAVDFKKKFDGHDPRRKIGLITSAEVLGDAIHIGGFLYAADFPEEVQTIKAEKEKLGFSFEAQSLMEDLKADPLVVQACVFTGAAVLYKDKAAYYDTSIAANAEEQDEMTKEQEAQLNALTTTLAGITTSIAGMGTTMKETIDKAVKEAVAAAGTNTPLQAASILSAVKTHAGMLRNCAKEMASANIGLHASRGHVAVLNNMADSLEAEASVGRIPHVYHDHMYAAAHQPDTTAIAAAAATKATEGLTATLKTITDSVAAMGTQLTDLKSKVAAAGDNVPNRKTFSADVLASLRRVGLEAQAGEGKKITVEELDKAVKAAGMSTDASMALKISLDTAGLLERKAA